MSQLAELKRILVGDHAKKVEDLKQRVEQAPNRTNDVSSVLPEAIEDCLNTRPEPFNAALGRSLPGSIKTTIENDPEGFATIFFPALAPSIRMMIAHAMRSFTSSMNQTIESATTLKGLGWRFESMRTGVPYAEIAMRKNLQYRVEQVFLISKESGLLIKSLINENVKGLDSDAVSAMLTAIQSFVRESFNASDEEDLTNMVVGDHVVWMVHGSDAVLASVIRGEAPIALRAQLANILDSIHNRHRKELVSFDGSTEIAGISSELEPCLQLKLKEYDGQRKKTSWLAVILLGALALGVLYWAAHSYERNKARNYVKNILAVTPGVLATNVFWDDNKLKVTGLMDPLAELPWGSITDNGVERDDVELIMKQYNSLEAEILARRLRRELAIPEEISISVTDAFDKKFAVLKGDSDFVTLTQLRERLAKLSRADLTFDDSSVRLSADGFDKYVESQIGLPKGINFSLDDSAITLSGIPEFKWFKSLTKLVSKELPDYTVNAAGLGQYLFNEVKATKLLFAQKTQLTKESLSQLEDIAENINQLNEYYKNRGQVLNVKVIGYTDGDNTKAYNRQAQIVRAQSVIDQLGKNNVDVSILKLTPNANVYADSERMVRLFPEVVSVKNVPATNIPATN